MPLNNATMLQYIALKAEEIEQWRKGEAPLLLFLFPPHLHPHPQQPKKEASKATLLSSLLRQIPCEQKRTSPMRFPNQVTKRLLSFSFFLLPPPSKYPLPFHHNENKLGDRNDNNNNNEEEEEESNKRAERRRRKKNRGELRRKKSKFECTHPQ